MTYRDLAKKRATKAAYNAAYQASHRKEIAAYQAAYAAAHRAEKKISNAAYRVAHRDEIAARKATRREDTAIVSRAYYAANRGRLLAGAAASTANQTAKALGMPDRIYLSDVLALWERQPVCVRCGNGRGLDHIIAFADGGLNVSANLQTMCPSCNTAKDGEAKMVRPRKAVCVRGHPQIPSNQRLNRKTGYIECRPCNTERARECRAHAGTARIVVG